MAEFPDTANFTGLDSPSRIGADIPTWRRTIPQDSPKRSIFFSPIRNSLPVLRVACERPPHRTRLDETHNRFGSLCQGESPRTTARARAVFFFGSRPPERGLRSIAGKRSPITVTIPMIPVITRIDIEAFRRERYKEAGEAARTAV